MLPYIQYVNTEFPYPSTLKFYALWGSSVKYISQGVAVAKNADAKNTMTFSLAPLSQFLSQHFVTLTLEVQSLEMELSLPPWCKKHCASGHSFLNVWNLQVWSQMVQRIKNHDDNDVLWCQEDHYWQNVDRHIHERSVSILTMLIHI